MTPNPGRLPPECVGRRIVGTLFNGTVIAPPGWAADGRGGCRWSLTGNPFDIKEYEVIA